ncbi:MAG TPA: hypothetical protein VJ501_15365 [Burkholderiaceae bacterium]|nr:hypothetical protein [Burkholderiaceae bacterium]
MNVGATLPRRAVVTHEFAVQCSGEHFAATETEVVQRPAIENRERAHRRTHSASSRDSIFPAADNERQRNQ